MASSSRGGRPSFHGSSSGKLKPADVAAEAKKIYIPAIKKMGCYPFNSHLFRQPINDCIFTPVSSLDPPPTFHVARGDPVDFAISWAASETERGLKCRIPFICAAHEKKVGGEWETAGGGYEEKLCRRSTLSAVLANPAEGQATPNYPIPMYGGILSDTVVVFRGPHPTYPVLETLPDLPVVSVHPMPRPKLAHNGSKYSFRDERRIVVDKIKACLRIVLWQGYTSVVIGDFGLGPQHRNPPRELAEIWREVFLYDPQVRGKFRHAAFVFEDPGQSTARLIAEDIAKKSGGGSSGSKGKDKAKSGSSSKKEKDGLAQYPTDYEIYAAVFSDAEVRQVLNTPDQRLALGTIMS